MQVSGCDVYEKTRTYHVLLLSTFPSFPASFILQSQLLPELFQCFNRLIVALGKLRQQLARYLYTHGPCSVHYRHAHCAQGHTHKRRIQSFGQSNVVDLLKCDVANRRPSISQGTAVRDTRIAQQKPFDLRSAHHELVSSVRAWHKRDLNGDFWPHLSRASIELLAESHHVDAKRTQCLANARGWLSGSRRNNHAKAPNYTHCDIP
mmetsp:Transcript_3180/g.6242  ORF Transcript_3180/g.6242 Transcript_3180/m.6242 type:complete len:206 (-) Transcript_3180:23-640(-)